MRYHAAMRRCQFCKGLVPSSCSACPHCDRLVIAPASGAARLARNGALAGTAAMTLMACYGAPGGYVDDATEGGLDSGPREEECDMEESVSVVEDDMLPITIDGTFADGDATNYGTCGGSGVDLVYQWVPPVAGTYRFEVTSAADTVLYLRTMGVGSCGDELACDDDGGTDFNSRLTVDLGLDPIYIVVDSYNGDQLAPFSLTIQAQ